MSVIAATDRLEGTNGPLLAAAVDELTAGQAEAALDRLSGFLAREPDCAAARLLAAEALEALGRTEAAWRELRLASAATMLDGEPSGLLPGDSAVDLAELAERLYESGAEARARLAIERAETLAPERAGVLLSRARLHLAAGEGEAAELALVRATMLAPDLALAHRMLAERLWSRGDGTEALARLQAAVAADAGDVRTHLLMADIWRSGKRHEPAEAAYRRVLALAPDQVAALHGLSAVLRDLGRSQEALPLAQRAVALAPDDPWRLVQLGNILAVLGRNQEAVSAYRAALAREIYLPGVPEALGRLLIKCERPAEAVELLALAAADSARTKALAGEVARLYLQIGRPADAVPWLRRVVSGNRDHKAVDGFRLDLARALLAGGRWRSGFAELAVVSAAPSLAPAPWPDWDGKTVLRGRTVLIDGSGLTVAEQVTLGGLLPELARDGVRLVFACAPSLVPVVMAWARVPLLAVATPLDDVTALPFAIDLRLPLAALARQRAASGSLRPEPWLSPEGAPVAKLAVQAAERRAVTDRQWQALGETVASQVGAPFLCADGEPEAVAAAVAGSAAILAGAGLAAALAGAMGLPGLVAVPPAAGWIWAAVEERLAWFPSLIEIPRVPAGEPLPVSRLTRSLFQQSAQPPLAEPSLPAGAPANDGDPRFADAMHRFAVLATLDRPTLTCTPLTGGTQNTLFRLSDDRLDLVLRLGRFPPTRWDVGEEERRNAHAAARAGVAPEVLAADSADGTMVTAFVAGTPMNAARFQGDPGRVAEVAGLYRRLHGLGRFMGRYDIFELVDLALTKLGDGGAAEIAEAAAWGQDYQRLKQVLRATMPAPVPCHNDPAAHNFVASPRGLVLVDWQCSSMGDPHWELGAFAADADLSPALTSALFSAYFSGNSGAKASPDSDRAVLYSVISHYYWMVQSLVWVRAGSEVAVWGADARFRAGQLRRMLAMPAIQAAAERLGGPVRRKA